MSDKCFLEGTEFKKRLLYENLFAMAPVQTSSVMDGAWCIYPLEIQFSFARSSSG